LSRLRRDRRWRLQEGAVTTDPFILAMPSQTNLLNVAMFTYWQEIFPTALDDLNPLHRDIVMYIMALPGKRRISYSHAKRIWNLDRDAFDAEVGYAFRIMLQHFKRHGLSGSADLDFT
jgi:hypothetical protein